jgi:hypothetical protein
MDHTNHVRLTNAELTPTILEGATIYGPDDEKIGSVDHMHGSQVVIDVGGFLGLGAKPVAVGFDNLVFSADTFGNRYLFLNTTREQLESQPTYDAATYAGQRDSQRMIIAP